MPTAAQFIINRYRLTKLTAILSFAALFLSGVYFVHPFDFNSANAATDTTSGTYNGTSYSLTTAVSDLNLELDNVTPASKAVYGKQTINVTTNAPGGYQLYMQTSGNLVGTKEGVATSDSIAALSSNNAALDMNTWGYTKTVPNEDYDAAATQAIWNTPPSTLTQVDSTSSAAASGRDTDIYYGIKADNSLDGDNYSGTIAYTTVASDITSTNESTNGLVVSPTSGTAGTATTLTITTPLMTTASLTASDITATVGSYSCTSITITSQAPLTFTCSVTISTAGTYDVTANISKYGKSYTKASVYTADTPTLKSSVNSAGITTMQELTNTICNNASVWASTAEDFTLQDSRDSKTYKIRKLADNHCWMVTNLAITNKAITASNSDSAGNFTVPASGSYNWVDSYDSAYMHIGSTSDSKSWNSSMGPYYNWYAATAGKGTQTTASSVNYSICPKNWKLPLGTTATYSWTALYGSYSGSAANFRTATNTSPAGGYYSGALYDVNTQGLWWSRTGGSRGSEAYALSVLGNGSVSPQNDNFNKRYGLAIRCVFVGS